MLIRTTQDHAIPVVLLREATLESWLAQQPARVGTWARLQGFRAERNKLLILADEQGVLTVVCVGLGNRVQDHESSLWLAAGLPDKLPEAIYQLPEGLSAHDAAQFVLGWEYGQYRFDRYKQSTDRKPRTLLVGESVDMDTLLRLNAACSLGRDLINTPANDLTPTALAQVAVDMAVLHGAEVRRYVGDELLAAGFPTVHAVGRAATAPPELVDFEWGEVSHPRVTLVGKGVCFDSGGLDIKPPSGMLLMKKDMGGAACTLALAQLVMQAKLPMRLRVIIPAVENAIAGNAFRPGDVIKTRAGLTVEVGNTDAEGRLILCDALALADADAPELLIDMATLTGAARVALGPELPALFTRDTQLANDLMAVGMREADPVWHLPLWSGYDDELSSKIADLNNISSTGFSGAIIGGLFLQQFVSKAKQWVHLDLYAWNAKDRPGRPAGAEAQCVRMLFEYLRGRFGR
ncbi:MAG: M17 family metallopeptidase [Steroidobacteraceae bacterium]